MRRQGTTGNCEGTGIGRPARATLRPPALRNPSGNTSAAMPDDVASAMSLQRRVVRLPQVQVEELVIVARTLAERDRALVRAVYERGLPLKALAAAGGTRTGRLQHRLRRILRRVRSPLFRAILHDRTRWSALRRDVAEGVILQGRSQRHIADRLGVSVHRVRMELEHIKALADMHRQHATRRESE